MKYLLEGKPGEKHILLGNEAIVRGAIEGGVGFVSCYPGTPSSEVPDTFFKLSKYGDFYFEYSINEKVALEVGGGAALGGVPTLVTMKHVGVNVAADPLMSLAYIGTPGGLVLLSADDPGCHSSQNEQDNRYYTRLAGLPCFEPSTAQEAKDYTKEALILSRKWQQPVMLRTTTRINHLRSQVIFGEKLSIPKPNFERDPFRFVPLPAIARMRHPILLKNLEQIQKEIEAHPFNKMSLKTRRGIIASGISRAYIKDVIADLGIEEDISLLELGITYPVPEGLILKFLKSVEEVLVLEELEPILENEVRIICQKYNLSTKVFGKDDNLTRLFEYSTTKIEKAVAKFLAKRYTPKGSCETPEDLPGRPPNLCPGCPHRAVYYSVRKIFGDDAIYATDIGCYTLGFLPPHRACDFLFCMGSSISGGSGMAKASGKTVIGYIGDSTFFHSGITGLINAVHNNHDLIVIILNNETTAMTGHQPHPGVESTIFGSNNKRVDIEAIVKACGVEYVKTINPLNLNKTLEVLKEVKDLSGVRVIIAKQPCTLLAQRVLKKKQRTVAYVAEQSEEVERCLSELACPAFYRKDDKILIDESICSGCMFCTQITKSIKVKKKEQN